MTSKTKYLPFVIAFAGLGLVLGYRHRQPSPTNPTRDQSETLPVTPVSDSPIRPNSPSPAMATTSSQDAVDPRDWIQNGPKEPLVPREFHVEAQLAPGSVVTAEPLVPREFKIDAELAPGETMNSAPLTPKEIRVEDPAR
jgi:hypothetical protein